VDTLEAELQHGELSETNRAWLAQCGLTPEQIQNQMEPDYTPERKVHLYHCDHRGLPLALVSIDGKIEWSAEYDAWGNVQRENNPHNLKQLIRLPGQQYDEETGLYYNRHRYYDPLLGRYITQDPIGLAGGLNPYTYSLNPVQFIDPLGLNACDLTPEPTALCGNPLFTGGMGPNKILDELGPKGGLNGSGSMLGTGVIGGGIVGAIIGQVDNAGRSVNPLADILTQEHKSGINPGGNCTPDELDKLQKQKDAFCNMPRSCSKNDSRYDLIKKMNINLACAHTRKTINNKCFAGGNKTHMDQENDAFKSSVNCRGFLNGPR
ncbi:RHS repeat-associated core domain-containing protein, partial [Salmonella enterica]